MASSGITFQTPGVEPPSPAASLCLHGHLMFGHAYSGCKLPGRDFVPVLSRSAFASTCFGVREHCCWPHCEQQPGCRSFRWRLSASGSRSSHALKKRRMYRTTKDFVAVQGFFAFGTSIRGAVWDKKRSVLADARMDEYLTHMPAIQFIPVRDFKPKRRYIAVPLFQIAAALPRARGQAEDPNFIAQVFLRSANEPDEWLLKGLAMLCESYT